jgi:hypothetical protein
MSKYTHLGGTFWKSDLKVFCEGYPLLLDPVNTQVFYEEWATDGVRVYHNCRHRKVIDASSFIALNGMYAKDAKNCFCDCISVSKTLTGADPASFCVLDSGVDDRMFKLGTNLPSGYAKDAICVYFNGNLVKMADVSTFISLQNGYGCDKSSIFFGQYRLPKAVPIRWRDLGGGYSRDDETVYYEHRPVRQARVIHFRQIEPFDSEFAYDGAQFFYRGQPMPVQEYVTHLYQSAEFTRDFAALVKKGGWQINMHEMERPYREPDETRFLNSDAKLGESRKTIERRFGTGHVIPAAKWHKYFENLEYEPGYEVLSWHRGRHEMVCILENSIITGVSFLNRD